MVGVCRLDLLGRLSAPVALKNQPDGNPCSPDDGSTTANPGPLLHVGIFGFLRFSHGSEVTLLLASIPAERPLLF